MTLNRPGAVLRLPQVLGSRMRQHAGSDGVRSLGVGSRILADAATMLR